MFSHKEQLLLIDSNVISINIFQHKITLNKIWNLVLTSEKIVRLDFRNHPVNPYPTAFPYGNGMVLHFYQQQESSTTKTVHKVINKRLKTYV